MKISFNEAVFWDGIDEYFLNYLKATFVREQVAFYNCSICHKNIKSSIRRLHLNPVCKNCSNIGKNKGRKHPTKKLAYIQERTFIDKIEELQLFEQYHSKSHLYYFCDICGKETVTTLSKLRKDFKLKCRLCRIKETCIEKYGSPSPFGNKQVQQKSQNTCIQKYGTANVMSLSELQEKSKQTCLNKYGTEYSFQSENNITKSKETCKRKYGVESYSQTQDFLEKTQATCIKHYGVPFPLQSEEIKQKQQNTCLERYGYRTNLLTDEMVLLSHQFKCHYRYNNISFDSSWEFVFYLYHIQLGHQIEREPCYFEYTFQGKVHKYYPDFKLPCGYVEVKGDHFFSIINGQEIMIDPYNHNDEKAQAKYTCALKHNVVFVKGEMIKEMAKAIPNLKQLLKDYKPPRCKANASA